MLKLNSINVHLNGSDSSQTANLERDKSENRSSIGDFGNFFLSFSLKTYNYYPTYHIAADFSDQADPVLWKIIFMKTFYNVVNSIIFCSKEARASIVLDIE